MSEEEEGTVDWKESLPEDMRTLEALKDVADVPSLAKQFVDQQSYLGNAIRIPGDDASDEDRSAFLQKLSAKVPELVPTPTDDATTTALMRTLGMPAEAEGYTVDLPENYVLPAEDLQGFQKMALDAGLTGNQFKKFVGQMIETDAGIKATNGEKMKTGIDALKGEWGSAFDQNLAAALSVAETSGAPKSLIDSMKAGVTNAETIKWLHTLAVGAAEGKHFQHGDGAPIMTPSEANSQIDEIMGNKGHAYWDSSSPAHKAAVEKVLSLMKLAHPGASTDMNQLRAGGMGSI